MAAAIATTFLLFLLALLCRLCGLRYHRSHTVEVVIDSFGLHLCIPLRLRDISVTKHL